MNLVFAPHKITADQLCKAIAEYVGIPYCKGMTYLVRDENGHPHGCANCFGLFLQVAKDLALLPADFEVNLPPAMFDGQTQAKTLWKIIYENFTRVSADEMAKGDLILMCYRDVKHVAEPHHVAMIVHKNCGVEIIHATEQWPGYGSVCRQPLDALGVSRIDSVWRMRNLQG